METFYRWLNFRGRRRDLCFLLLYSPQEEPPRCQNCKVQTLMGVEIFKKSPIGLLLLLLADINSALWLKKNSILSKNSLQKGRPKLLFPLTFLDMWKLP